MKESYLNNTMKSLLDDQYSSVSSMSQIIN